jgi:hypothetical protein
LAGLLPLLLWLACLLASGGPPAVRDYFRFTVDGSLSMARTHQAHIPAASFDWRAPFARSSQVALAHLLVPALCVLALVLCALRLRRRGANRERLLVLGAAALGGLCLYPQALHAREQQHLLQTLPLFPALLALLARELAAVPLATRPARLAAAVVGLVALLMVVQVRGGFDLRFAGTNVLTKWRQLAGGPPADSRDVLLAVMATAERVVPPGEPVLVLPCRGEMHPTQFYAWIRRPQSGLFNIYYPGLFADDHWRLRNFHAVLADPPVVAITNRGALRDQRTVERSGHVELIEWVRDNYTEVVFFEHDWLIVKRPAD